MGGTPVRASFYAHVKRFDQKILQRHSTAIRSRALPHLQQVYDAERYKISSWMAHRFVRTMTNLTLHNMPPKEALAPAVHDGRQEKSLDCSWSASKAGGPKEGLARRVRRLVHPGMSLVKRNLQEVWPVVKRPGVVHHHSALRGHIILNGRSSCPSSIFLLRAT